MSDKVKIIMEKDGKKYTGQLPPDQLDKVDEAELKGFRLLHGEVK
jgi:hypothetical protein